MKRSTLILKLTNMVLATSNNHTAEITATISSGNPFYTNDLKPVKCSLMFLF